MDKESYLEILKKELQDKEREATRIWESFWFVLWILLPVVGWLILLIILVNKLTKSVRLENDCSYLRNKIRDLENKLWREKQKEIL